MFPRPDNALGTLFDTGHRVQVEMTFMYHLGIARAYSKAALKRGNSGVKLFKISGNQAERVKLRPFLKLNYNMGLNLLGSSSTFDTGLRKVSPPNPDPTNFKILKSKQIGNYLIVKIKYYGCTSYEGRKVLLFEDCSIHKLMGQGLIDPHFSENTRFQSPIARFVPTDRGWKMAGVLAEYYSINGL